MRAADVNWPGICRICALAETDRCRSCPTRSRALMSMLGAFQRRWRWTIAYAGFVVTTAAVVGARA